MHRYLVLIPAAMLTIGSSVAASPFDGTWKVDIGAGQLSTKPDVYLLSGGKYLCSTCTPKIAVAADGAFHPVVGNPYFDTIAVTVIDTRTIKRVTKKAGKPATESTVTVSLDGKSMTSKYKDMTATNGVVVTGTGTSTRVAAAAAGAHAASGSWQQTNNATSSDNGLIFTMAVVKDTVTYSSPTGIAYKVVLGGPQAPVTGDPGWSTVAMKRDGNGLSETDYRAGKAIGTYLTTASADGKALTVKGDDLLTGKKATFVARKQ